MIHLHSVLEGGAKSATTKRTLITYLDDLGLYGQQASGGLLRIKFQDILIYCIPEPSVTILGVIEAYHA